MRPPAPRLHRAAPVRATRGRRPEPEASASAAARPVLAEPATLVIRGLAARTYIGVTPAERTKRQDVLIDLTLDVTTRAGRTDRIGDAVDYKTIKEAVLDYVEETEHNLLEALAQGIADLCLVHASVHAVEVEVDKPGALRFARSVAVRLRRERLDRLGRPARSPRKPRVWGHRE
ncbi:MAG TPA: dihydroneopterin aldolase [Candidatus Thermoplasmatota archaeon]|nr:dihydroneopterin aldolase [Candidatus Thermoplasmatota archaeon]